MDTTLVNKIRNIYREAELSAMSIYPMGAWFYKPEHIQLISPTKMEAPSECEKEPPTPPILPAIAYSYDEPTSVDMFYYLPAISNPHDESPTSDILPEHNPILIRERKKKRKRRTKNVKFVANSDW